MMTNKLTQLNIELFGVGTAQSWADLWILNKALCRHKPELIIEIGTFLGGTALFFSNFAETHTFDIKNSMIKSNNKIFFYYGDVFKSHHLLPLLIDKRKKFLFCDGGNKINEFNLFAKMVNAGDYVFVHDWGTEIKRDDILLDGFKDILREESEEVESYVRGFVKI